MSGWLHPEGPESTSTYWSRRLVVIAAAVVTLVLCVVTINRVAQGSEPETAGPAPVATNESTLAPTSAPTSAATSAPTGSSAPTTDPSSSAGASGSASTSSSPSTSTSASAAASATAAAPSASGSSSATATGSASASPTSGPTGSTSTGPSTSGSTGSGPVAAAEPTTCAPAALRATLRGKADPKIKEEVTFSLSLINGGAVPCVVKRNADTVELKIYSGTDRISSTDDCARSVAPVATTLKSEQAVSWTMTWNGLRSAAGCTTRPEVPKAGTYFATFQFTGAKPVQQRMVLTAR